MGYLHDVILECRENLGFPPREWRGWQRRDFRLRLHWLSWFIFHLTKDGLVAVLRDQHLLRDHGWVVWGALVQANQRLFRPENRLVLPANAIYSPDPYFDDQAFQLKEIASGLFDLKGTDQKDPAQARFAQAITDELERNLKLPLPPSISKGRTIHFTTLFIQPSHLPGGYLATGLFPLVICPERTDAVMILPAHYWPEDFCNLWLGEE